MSSYRIADYIIDFISSIGVDKIFLLPGGGCMHLVDAVALNKNIEPITCQHEQAAVISAEAYGRVHKSGIGVAIVTSGPGSTNAITGVTGAWLESIPMIIISGQVKRSDLNIEKKVRQKGPQEIDIVTIVQSITKFSETIIDPSKIKKTLQKAYIEAKSGRKGPVWLDVPLDIQGTPIEKIKTSQNSWVDWKENPTLVHSELQKKIKACQSALKESIRPLILVGHGVRLAGASGDFTNFVNKLGIPVVSTWNALDLLEFNSPYYVGRPGVVASRAPNFAIQNCDLLISIGCRIDNIVSAFNQKDFARNAKKILIDCDINEINKHPFESLVTIHSTVDYFLSNFPKEIYFDKKAQVVKWQKRCLNWKKKFHKEFTTAQNNNKISHFEATNYLSDSLPENALIVTGSSGLAVEAFYTAFENRKGQRVFHTSALGAMGYGLPAAIGACLGVNKTPTFAIESDGSLQLNIQELATITANKLPILLFIFNNEGYCSIRNTQTNYFESRFVGTNVDSGLFMPSLKLLAESYGISYSNPKRFNEIENVIKLFIENERATLVEINLIETDVLFPKVSAIPQPDGSIISMPLEDMTPLLPLSELKKEMLTPISEESISVRKKSINR